MTTNLIQKLFEYNTFQQGKTCEAVRTGYKLKKMDKNTIKIRIGRGAFNDIVINDNTVLNEHCYIVCDKSGCRVVNLNRDAKTFVNNNEVNWEATISQGDELRFGNTVVTWAQIEKTVREVQGAGKHNRESLVRRVGMFIGYYAIYFMLGWFVLYSFSLTTSTALKIISICLYLGFVLYTIEPSKWNRQRMNEGDLVSWRKNRVVILIITAIFLIKFVLKFMFQI